MSINQFVIRSADQTGKQEWQSVTSPSQKLRRTYLPPSRKLQTLSSRFDTNWNVSRIICCCMSSFWGDKSTEVSEKINENVQSHLQSIDKISIGEGVHDYWTLKSLWSWLFVCTELSEEWNVFVARGLVRKFVLLFNCFHLS